MTMRRVPILMLLVCIFGGVQRASAHPADLLFQAHTITLNKSGAQIEWQLFPGYLLVPNTWREADMDGDGAVAQAEASTWAADRVAYLSASLDDQPLSLSVLKVDWPSSQAAFQIGQEVINVTLTTKWADGLAGTHTLQFENHYEDFVSIETFQAAASEISIVSSEETPSSFTVILDFSTAPTSEQPHNESTQTERGPLVEAVLPLQTPTLSPSSTDTPTPPPTAVPASLPSADQPAALLTGLVSAPQLSSTFYILALLLSLGLGALHALTPGHGKTVVAAYLVGSRGTLKYAIALGGITTLTHTGSVLVLGTLALTASHFILPTTLFPILEVASGALIIVLGLGLLWQRWRALRSEKHHHEHHDEDHHHHSLPQGAITWRSLIALGVSGGLVPCPDAIAILLVAITINRIVLGLSLIVAFSLGLALVLIVIGIAVVHGARLLVRFDQFHHVTHALPVVSALAVTVLGIALVIGVLRVQAARIPTLPAATQVVQASPTAALIASPTVKANTNLILFLTMDDQALTQIASIWTDGTQLQFLTHSEFGIRDFSVTEDGSHIAYSEWQDGPGSDLWVALTGEADPIRVLRCPEAACSSPVWLPDERHIVYVAQFIPIPEAGFGAPSLWILDTATGDTHPLLQEADPLGFNPVVAPNGSWIAADLPDGQGIQIAHPNDGQIIRDPDIISGMFAWSPDSQFVVASSMVFDGAQTYTALVKLDVESGNRLPLEIEETSQPDDRLPTWSPDGSRIAFIRQAKISSAEWHSEIWVVQADGSNPHPVIQDTNFIYERLVWSPAGDVLLAEATRRDEPDVLTGVWRVDLETSSINRLAAPASKAIWIP